MRYFARQFHIAEGVVERRYVSKQVNCPHCLGTQCKQCNFTGSIEIQIPAPTLREIAENTRKNHAG